MAAKTTSRSRGQIYIANESFVADRVEGDPTTMKQFFQGRTRVYEGDPILERCPETFDLIEDHDTGPQSYS